MCRVVSPPCNCRLENSASCPAVDALSALPARLLSRRYDPAGDPALPGPTRCLFNTSMSSEPLPMREPGDPYTPPDCRSGLSYRREPLSNGDVPPRAGERCPLNAWEREDVPGPGTDPPPAPANGVVPGSTMFCGRLGLAEGVPSGEVCTGVASRAVAEALVGDWEYE